MVDQRLAWTWRAGWFQAFFIAGLVTGVIATGKLEHGGRMKTGSLPFCPSPTSEGIVLPKALIEKIRDLHSGPRRGYHGWSHPLALIRWYELVKSRLNDPLAVYCAILLHDAVYEPRRPDNESRSAALAEELLNDVVPDASLNRTFRLIEATARHAIPPGLSVEDANDMAMFLDMDLSILAAPQAAFDAYEDGVRHEYQEVPEEAFRAGRASILEGFLERDALYMSPWGQAEFETKARANLKRSVAKLRSKSA
ncbi:MAG: hypothetical protein Q8L23_01945 [Caulobacter sp.]|nr:hypothetical protein [Caulobacter sp.]